VMVPLVPAPPAIRVAMASTNATPNAPATSFLKPNPPASTRAAPSP
jgi:hypothetical protein